VPMLVAEHLSRQQRFAEADEWLRLVFDPTSPDAAAGDPADPGRFWRFLPFRSGERPDRIEDLMAWLANPTSVFPGRTNFLRQITRWRDNPFRPHEIARMRPGAYQWKVLFAQLDNLIAWGDDRFRRDTRESIVEATMLYVQAAKILGPPPRTVQPQLQPPVLTYRSMVGRWDDFANVWTSLADNPFVAAMLAFLQWLAEHGIAGQSGTDYSDAIATLTSTGMTYFGVPHNDKLLGYWTTVEDRLFKIRHSQNIEGVERQLPLYPPPIDPDLLVRAVAAGVDLEAAVAGTVAPPSQYRFAVLVQRATELCAEVKALGAAVLGALERKDGELLARLRAEQEVALLELVEDVRVQQVAEARAAVDALAASREATASRYRHFQQLLTGGDVGEPAEGFAPIEQPSKLLLVPSADAAANVEGLGLAQTENDQLARLAEAALSGVFAGVSNAVAAIFFAIGAYTVTTPIQGFGHAANAVGSTLNALSSYLTNQAGRDAIVAGYQRRSDDWRFQSNTALRDLAQIDKQLAAARIRTAIAEHELANHRQQRDDARAVGDFLRGKYTNVELFTWMGGELGGVYFAAYQLALEASKQAERAFRYELYQPDASFIQPRYWDSLHQGLTAGEQLSQDLKRLEAAYLDRNRREHEMVRNVSLRELDPVALLALRATGSCEFTVPERLFDLDMPGQFLRRLKSVSLTMPCVAGPYAAVHATLTLLSSTVRHRADGGAGYERDQDGDDPRFSDDFGLAESIVTSGTVDASGVWEPNLRDQQRMPFEGRGAISRWRLTLPAEYPQFDHDTISDVVLTLRYSARNGGDRLRQDAVAALDTAFAAGAGKPATLLVSMRHEFPTEWARFTAPGAGSRTLTFALPTARFPALFLRRTLTVTAVDVYSAGTGTTAPGSAPSLDAPAAAVGGSPEPLTLDRAADLGAVRHDHADELAVVVQKSPERASWRLTASAPARAELRDVLLVLTYTAAKPSVA
jgi:Tc toxin complex TcA C-terminal TcB-binding domain